MYKPPFESIRPTPDDLKQALGFKKQHINVITRELHKIWPDLWPHPSIGPSHFYETLLATVVDDDRYSVLEKELEKIAKKKGGKWRNLSIGKRVFDQVGQLFERLSPDDFLVAIRDVKEMNGPEVLAWTSEHLKGPEYEIHKKVLGWLVGIETRRDKGQVDVESEQDESVMSETATKIHEPTQDLATRWDKVLEDLSLSIEGSGADRFSRDLIRQLAEAVEVLTQLAETYDEECSAEDSAVLERLLRTLDDIEPFLSDKEPAERQLLVDMRAQAVDARFPHRLRMHSSSLDGIEGCLHAMRVARKRYKELGRLMDQARGEEDDDAVIVHAQERKLQNVRLSDEKKALVGALDEILRKTESLAETNALAQEPSTVAAVVECIAPIADPELVLPRSDEEAESQAQETTICGDAAPEQEIPECGISVDSAVAYAADEKAGTDVGSRERGLASDESDRQIVALVTTEQVPAESEPDRSDAVTVAAEQGGAPFSRKVGTEAQSQGQSVETPLEMVEYPPDIASDRLVSAISEHPESSDCAVNALIWTLVRDGRLDLAYHLARAMEARGSLGLAAHDANCLLALFLARQIQGPTDDVAEPLREALSSLLLIDFSSRPVRHRRANALLAYAAALRPALLAPNLTGARAVLEEGHLLLESTSLHELRKAILDSGRLGQTLTAASLKGQAGPGGWERHLAELSQGCQTWWSDYRNRRIRYAPTTKVWQLWLEDDGPIGTLLGAVAEDRRDLIDHARAQIDGWRDSSTVNRRLDQTDIGIRGRSAALWPIDGSPRNDVVRLAAEAMRFVQEWLDLHTTRPTSAQSAGSPELREWIQRTGSLLDKATDDLSQVLTAPAHLFDHAAACAVGAALDDLRDLLDPAAPIRRGLPWWKRFSEPLLLDPGIDLDEQWRPSLPYTDGDLFQRLLALVNATDTWEIAFTEAEQDCAHGATERILEALGSRDPQTVGLDALRKRRDTSLENCQRRLQKRVQQVDSAVAHAVDYGYLDEDERAKVGEVLESCKGRRRGDIGAALRELDRIEEDLRDCKQRRIDEERERLKENDTLKGKPELRERIEHLLDQGEIATAAEYVTHAENGREPPSDERSNSSIDEFFPSFVSAATRNLGDRRGGDILRALEAGSILDPLAQVSGDAESSVELLRAWVALQGRRGKTRDLVRELISTLGFVVSELEVEGDEQSGEALLRISTETLQDRTVCIVPQYGSLARGRYRVVCIWDRMPAEDLRKHLGRRDGVPTLLLYLNRMSENQRRELAFQCRQNRQTFLVLDEWLLYFLLNQDKGARLPVLFRCGFPFTVANPYTPTSSDVPDELFFGRRRAMEQIADLHGSNLVFGGRQLGKTALLREVKRRYHAPNQGFIVSWIDLKAAEIGLRRPLADVWAVIGGVLAGFGLMSRQVSRPETVQKEILAWLDADSNRRLLILLDEADDLFAQDAEAQYATLMGLKNLMERTHRRFKVVFAGLHNVQRMSRDVNSPVKHLSQPVCVGPLLENGEARDAFRLVSLPLQTLGYRLADDVVNTILSYTNYYPNLIQHFCHSLLEFLNDPDQVRFDSETTPPYEITPEHVEQAYRRRELRQFIRDRFQITLDLDPRYRVIALRIALETLERRKNDEETAGGFSVEWIREQGLALWRIGFKDRTIEAFRTLLDEMVGLGILRHAQRGYALRSPTIVNLLGAHDAIQQDLLDACDKAPPPIYTAATYRRSLGTDQWQRSPLVAEQEYEILSAETGITLLFGAALSGVERVADAIETASESIPEAVLHRLGDARDHNDFEKRMRSALDKQGQDTHLVMLVDQDCAWNEAWIRCAAKAICHKHSKKTTARVVFIGDAAMGWLWSGISTEQSDEFRKLRVMTLKPWAEETLHQWQRDTAIGPVNDTDLRKITDASGLWDQRMFDLGDRMRCDPRSWRKALDEAHVCAPEALSTLMKDLDVVVDAKGPLEVFADVGEALTAADLVDLAELPNRALADRVLVWIDLLSFGIPEGDGKWSLDPFVMRLIAGRDS